MKKVIFLLVLVAGMAANISAEQKYSFVIEGSEKVYNQIRITNRTSVSDIHCRVVVLKENNEIKSVYGIYNLSGYDDSDTNTERITRGTKIGLQFPENFNEELLYSVEYRDYPLFDAVVITLYDANNEFSRDF